MKKIFIYLCMCISFSLTYAADMSQMSGFYIDEDIVDGRPVTNAFHSQVMDKKTYKKYIRNSAVEIVTTFCNEDKFSNQNLDEYRTKILNSDQKICDEILEMPLNSYRNQVIIISYYKEKICNRNLNPEFNLSAGGLAEAYKREYSINCKSNPKELTFQELSDYNKRTNATTPDVALLDPLNSSLGTLGPSAGFGFNFNAATFGPAGSKSSPNTLDAHEGSKDGGWIFDFDSDEKQPDSIPTERGVVEF